MCTKFMQTRSSLSIFVCIISPKPQHSRTKQEGGSDLPRPAQETRDRDLRPCCLLLFVPGLLLDRLELEFD